MVVHGYNTPCVCAPYWAYAVRVGIEPTSAALALPESALPRRRVVLTSRCADYLLVLVQQNGQPICFLYSCVQFAVLPGKIVRLALGGRDAHRTDELHFGTCSTTLRG